MVVNADEDTTWQAVGHGDLSRSLVIRRLLERREPPCPAAQAGQGLPPEPARPPLTLDDITRAQDLRRKRDQYLDEATWVPPTME